MGDGPRGRQVVQGHVRDLPREEREVLVEQDIRSLVEVPILVGGRWWGTIGFDDCLDEREWTSVEVDALRAAAGVMGAAIGRRATEDRLLEAERKYRALVERIPAVTYRETPDADPEGFYTHDLRTPLAAILGLAVTLEREDVGLSADDTRDLARRIAANARKLARMVTDLLDLDRLARGIVEPKSQPTDVGALVRRVLSDSELLSERDVRIEAPELVIATDGAKVERIVENLLANTARHTPRQTRAWIRVSPADPGALLVVEDDGPGIPEDLRDAIFEALRQGPGASEHSPGVGVGLALVARFAELLGGGRGSRSGRAAVRRSACSCPTAFPTPRAAGDRPTRGRRTPRAMPGASVLRRLAPNDQPAAAHPATVG